MKSNKGITLIALVITIIVLLILAGVSISLTLGNNGILNQATKAVNKTKEASADEEIGLAWSKVFSDSLIENYNEEQSASALQIELRKEDGAATVIALESKLIINYKGYSRSLNMTTGDLSEIITASKAKQDGIVFVDNTKVIDLEGIEFIVPKGFKIASDSSEKVTEGIVIEDASYENTIGSQFVWIPVGIPWKTDTTKTIELGRYVFESNGNINTTLSKSNPQDELKTSQSSTYYYIEKLKNSGESYPKDIESFITKTNTAKGFYIGRYEARTSIQRTSGSQELTQITEKGSEYVYNYVTQAQASNLAKEMYANNNYFESDLVNSFAWDTATLFLQEYDNRTGENLPKYSRQERRQSNYVNHGTSEIDRICNVYDMSSNYFEVTTEFCNNPDRPWAQRGGSAYSSGYNVSYRNAIFDDYASHEDTFRPIIYIK